MSGTLCPPAMGLRFRSAFRACTGRDPAIKPIVREASVSGLSDRKEKRCQTGLREDGGQFQLSPTCEESRLLVPRAEQDCEARGAGGRGKARAKRFSIISAN